MTRPLAIVLGALLAAGCSHKGAPPRVDSIEPSSVRSAYRGAFRISGASFLPSVQADFDRPDRSPADFTFSVALVGPEGEVPLEEVSWESEAALIARSPGELLPGTYAVVVSDARGLVGRLEAALEVIADCALDQDCSAPPTPCHRDSGACDRGVCRHPRRAVGEACTDADLCTASTTCDAEGTCGGGAPEVCPPPSDTRCYSPTPSCDPLAGCGVVPLPAGTECDDRLACTQPGATCDGQGGCAGGAPVSCLTPPASNGCWGSTGTCQEPDASCDYAPVALGTHCSDADACTETDACDGAGGCAGAPVTCNSPPSVQCYSGGTATCAAATGCSYPPLDTVATCDDGDGCTTPDNCDGSGGCRGTFVSALAGCNVNLPPRPCLLVSPPWGHPQGDPSPTTFTVSAACSEDRESPTTLSFRYDFNGDGSWDYPAGGGYTSEATVSTSYAASGVQRVIVEVRDDGAPLTTPLSAWTERRVAVATRANTLIVTADLTDELDPGFTLEAPLGRGLSLAEAISYLDTRLLSDRVIAFDPALRTITGGAIAPSVAQPGTVIVGHPGLHLRFDTSAAGATCLDFAATSGHLIGLALSNCDGHPVSFQGASARMTECELTPGARNSASGELLLRSSKDDESLFFGPANLVHGFTSSAAISIKGPRTVIEGNRFYGNTRQVVDATGQASTRVRGNLFHDSSGLQVGIKGSSNDSQVLHNTFHQITGNAVEFGNTTGIIVRNNLFSEVSGTAITGPANSFAADGRNHNGFSSVGMQFSPACAACVVVVGNPVFHAPEHPDPWRRDLRLQPTSAMLNAGADLGLSQPDQNGPDSGLWTGPAPDLGARESPF